MEVFKKNIAPFNPFSGPEIDYVVYTTKAQSEIWTGFPCFLTGFFNVEDLTQIINTFKKCLDKMISAGFFITNKSESIVPKQPAANKSVIINKPSG